MRSLRQFSKHGQRSRHLQLQSVCQRYKTTATKGCIQVENPYTGETYCEVEKIGSEQIDKLLSEAVAQQREWWTGTMQNVGLVERQYVCGKFLEAFKKYEEQIAIDISSMMGKPLQQSRNEVNTMYERAQAVIEMSTQFLSDQPVPPKHGFDRRIRKEPLGTILIVAPWNYPLLCTINSLLPAILCGNSVILKLSSKTPTIANYFAKAFEDAGCPQGLITPLHCDHDTTSQIIKDQRVSGVVFTGSVEGGYEIQAATANRLIDATLELGGKDPAYVARDADLRYAVESIVDGAMYNAGQSCCAIERVYVHKEKYNDFIDMAQELVSSQYVLGDPLYEHPRDIDNRKYKEQKEQKKEHFLFQQAAAVEAEHEKIEKQYDANLPLTTNLGPMAQKSSIEFLSKQVNDAVDKGAKLVIGDNRGCQDANGKGRFFRPTILSECDHSMSVMMEESFGPILPVQCVSDDQQAVELMNDSKYGLTAAVYTKDKMKMEKVFASQLRTGTVFMNRCDYLDPFLPWTGVKDTGKGVSLSHYGFNNFTKLKSLHYKLRTD